MTVRASLRGLHSPLSVTRRIFYPGDKAPGPGFDPSSDLLEIHDARLLQAQDGSESACFDAHGFALLEHDTAVRAWGMDPAEQAERARIYHPEIETLVRERLFPGRRVEIEQRLKLVTRGGPEDAVYADWVHQDFGLTAGDFARNLAGITTQDEAIRWRERYERDDVTGCVAISFWRTLGMRQPLLHMPIALCDPGTVSIADVISGVAADEGGNYHIMLRYDPRQRWYHYPGITSGEMLAFKLFECRKDDPAPERLRSVFHGAFVHPMAPDNVERRVSCEHRIWVMLLRD